MAAMSVLNSEIPPETGIAGSRRDLLHIKRKVVIEPIDKLRQAAV
jgi:hypothetical protein